MKEMWKTISDFPDYEISNLGRVKSNKRAIPAILKQRIGNTGYFMVTLNRDGNRYHLRTHQLMAMVFLNHKPDGFTKVVDHINSDQLDNRLQNLRIVTQRENTQGSIERELPVGVYLPGKRSKSYAAIIRINGEKVYLGSFKTIEEAKRIYDNKVKEIDGDKE